MEFDNIISVENLLLAWQEFVRGKRKKRDVQEFSHGLIDNILELHHELVNGTYRHGGYHYFRLSDPKPREISKAQVRDRLLHHAIYRILYPFFDKHFIYDSFSCRVNKGTHKAMNRFQEFGRIVSRNNTRTAWVLKLDIKKFFASIDHEVLLGILKNYISDQKTIWLLQKVILSFQTRADKLHDRGICPPVGLPLGNLTSQLFCNLYMSEFDQFVKHRLKARYYIRYADDFVLFSENRSWLLDQLSAIAGFLEKQLKLSLHPNKIVLKTLASGVDFLGWVHFPSHRVLRTATRKRMFRRIKDHPARETMQSYLGLLQHGNAYKLRQKIID